MLAAPSIANAAQGDQTGSTTFNPDQAPPLGATFPVMNEAGDDNDNDDSSLPDLKALCQALLNGLDPGANPEDTRRLRDYLSAHPFPDESGAWNTVAADEWLQFSPVSMLQKYQLYITHN